MAGKMASFGGKVALQGETEYRAALKTTYATELANRKVWRKQINNLEEIH